MGGGNCQVGGPDEHKANKYRIECQEKKLGKVNKRLCWTAVSNCFYYNYNSPLCVACKLWLNLLAYCIISISTHLFKSEASLAHVL